MTPVAHTEAEKIREYVFRTKSLRKIDPAREARRERFAILTSPQRQNRQGNRPSALQNIRMLTANFPVPENSAKFPRIGGRKLVFLVSWVKMVGNVFLCTIQLH